MIFPFTSFFHISIKIIKQKIRIMQNYSQFYIFFNVIFLKKRLQSHFQFLIFKKIYFIIKKYINFIFISYIYFYFFFHHSPFTSLIIYKNSDSRTLISTSSGLTLLNPTFSQNKSSSPKIFLPKITFKSL